MKALDAYKDVLKELDKYESPTFTIRDFNYFYNSALSSYIDLNYKALDQMQKEDDDLSALIKRRELLTMDAAGEIALPSDYRHLLNARITMKFLANVGKYRTDQEVSFTAERMKSGQKGFRSWSSFGRPRFNRYYYETDNSTFRLLFDSALTVPATADNLLLDYIVQPNEVYLNPVKSSDYNDVANNSLLTFAPTTTRNHIYYEVARMCRAFFLENIESQRGQFAFQQASQQ